MSSALDADHAYMLDARDVLAHTRGTDENCDPSAEDLVARWANTPEGDVLIDDAGNVHDGLCWLNDDRLADLVTWLKGS